MTRSPPISHFDDLALASDRSPAELEQEIRLLLAVKLLELKRVSTGHAADIAGLSRLAFFDQLAKLGIAAIDFDPDEAEQEFGDAWPRRVPLRSYDFALGASELARSMFASRLPTCS